MKYPLPLLFVSSLAQALPSGCPAATLILSNGDHCELGSKQCPMTPEAAGALNRFSDHCREGDKNQPCPLVIEVMPDHTIQLLCGAALPKA